MSNPLARRWIAGATASLLGLGLVGLTAAPASAADVTDITSLNAAIAADEPLITITNDFTLTASIDLIDYDVTIVGNGHTIDADYFGSFVVSGASATISDLTIVKPGFAAVDLDLGTGDSATLTNVSATDSQYGVYVELGEDSSFTMTGGTLTDSDDSGVYVRDHEGSGTVSISGTVVTGADDGIELDLDGTTRAEVSDAALENVYFGINAGTDDEATIAVSTTSIVAGSDHNDGGDGAGLYLSLYGESSFTFDNGSITGDLASSYFDHGVQTYQADSSVLAITDSRISQAENGVWASSMFEGSSLVMTRVVVSGSGGEGVNGDFFDDSTLSVIQSTITGNGNVGLEVDFSDTSTANVDRSTFSENVDGGAWFYLYNESSASFVNSTVSGNTAGDYEGWALWAGGSNSGDHGTLTVRNSTVTDNTGIVGLGFEVVTGVVSHTIVAGNHIVDPVDYAFNGEVWIGSYQGTDTDVSVEWSILGDITDQTAGAGYTEGPGVTTGVTDPGLGALADNGGPTLTHLPASNSPAVDAGDPAVAGAPATDQRGQTRIRGAAIDIGAVELQPQLAATGADATGAWWAGAMLLILGAGALAGARLRRRRV